MAGSDHVPMPALPPPSPAGGATVAGATVGSTIGLGLLGPIVVVRDGEVVGVQARLDRSVLAHLALAEGRVVSTELLVDALWGERPPPRARNALQVKVSRLRRRLRGSGAELTYQHGGYRLLTERSGIDVLAFSDLLGDAEAEMAAGRHDAAHRKAGAALELWRGEPLTDVVDHPRFVNARDRLREEWCAAHELLAEIGLVSDEPVTATIARLRSVLDADPLRPRARLLLMRALEAQGRRGDALAVYDAGRRLLAEQLGLAPPDELQALFETLLAAERQATHRAARHEIVAAPPPGATETARWLAAQGENGAAIQLALRGAWWWWFGGRRTAGRELLEDLLGREADPDVDAAEVLGASAWLSVFQSLDADAAAALSRGEATLERARGRAWSRHQALAATLLAERLYQRGEPRRAEALARASRLAFAAVDDRWGLAVVAVVEAKARILAGDVATAAAATRGLLRSFDELADPAGQIMALDVAGYCAEVRGDLELAARIHRRALDLARRVGAPEWETGQLTRLGSVLTLMGAAEAAPMLESAAQLAASLDSKASLALAQNALGVALGVQGAAPEAAAIHQRALAWYDAQESPAGVSYTAGRLAGVVREADPDRAIELARRSLLLAAATRDPLAVAHGLESLVLAHPDPVEQARALGGARALRKRSAAPLATVFGDRLAVVERDLVDRLRDAYLGHARDGVRRAQRLLRAEPAEAG